MSGLLYDLWVDGVLYQVPRPVWAHVQFLSDLNSNMAHRLAAMADQLKAARPANVHWTPQIKETLILRAKISPVERQAVMLVFSLTDEELDGWIDRYAKFGIEGLKVTRIQDLREGEAA